MMPSSIRIDRDVPMEMRDGVVLRADVYRPDDNEKHPTILVRTPYNKSAAGGSGEALTYVDAGYALAIQDIRGRFASDGEFGTRQGAPDCDGYDTVEGVAAEPWCDGNIGMIGGSWVARTQWEAALANPPHLKAIAPAISRYGPLDEISLLGGVPRFEVSVGVMGLFGVDWVDKMEQEGKDVSEMREMIDRSIYNPEEVYDFLPLKAVPHFDFEGLRDFWAGWFSNVIPGPIKSERDFFWPMDRITVPCFHVGGWFDIHSGAMFKTFLKLRAEAGSQQAREGQHVLYGPWFHDGVRSPFVGGLYFGPEAGGGRSLLGPGADVVGRHIEFFNKYLRGMDVDVPVVRYFVMGRNRWAIGETWPLPQTQWQRFFFHSKGHANTAQGDGLLSTKEPGSEPSDIFVYDPAFPVPTTGGRGLQMTLISGPVDQYHVEKRADVLCYSTPEVDEDVEVTGPIALHLFASTTARDTDFVAKLVDVYPDGRAYNVADGILRARFRKSILQSELVSPGDVMEYLIDMGATGNVFRKGHRIRIQVSSSNFPRYDRNMNTGNPLGQDAQGIPAMQTIYHQPDYASYIDLPTIPG